MPLPFYPQTPGLMQMLGGYEDPTLQAPQQPTAMPAQPAPAAAPPGLLERIAGPTPNYGGLLDPAAQNSVNNQFLLNLGAGLLAGSGSGQRFGAILGQAYQGAQQQKAQAIQEQIRNMVLQAQIKKAEEDKKGDLVAIIGPDGRPKYVHASDAVGQLPFDPTGSRSGMIGTVNPGEYTPESVALYQQTHNYADLKRYVTPANPVVQLVNGVPTVVQPDRGGGAPTQKPLSDLPGETDAKRRLANAAAQGTETGKNTANAQAALPETEATIDQSLDTINKLKASPGLRYIVGGYSAFPVVPGTSQADAAAKAEQLQSQNFVNQFQKLKGAGRITQFEAQKAEQALTSLQRNQSLRSYKNSLDDLVGILNSAKERARNAAGGNSAAPATNSNDPLGIR